MKFQTKMNSYKGWTIVCFFNFLIASLMGLLMRFLYVYPLNINYSFLLHAHSHIAMLGWAYLMIYVLIVQLFIPKDKNKKPIYNRLFWFTEFAVVGMMLSFPFQGYAVFSIIFSTLHILLSYVFCYLVWRDCFKTEKTDKRLLLAAVLFMVFSTLGVWCLGPAINLLGKQSAFYQIAIQFFLHFQFNGWFLLAVLALFLRQFKNEIIEKRFRIFFTLLIVATFLTAAFPVSWYLDIVLLKYINSIGVVMQLFAFVYFYKMFQSPLLDFISMSGSTTKMVYSLAVSSLFLKILVQLLLLIPDIAEVSHQIRNLVIGFIHLTTLGIITGFLFGILLQNKMISDESVFLRLGIKSFVLGYIATEALLFIEGGFIYFREKGIPHYYEVIFIMSALIVLGLTAIVFSLLNTKKTRVD